MTPAESREITLSLSRERLARAIAKFERVSRDAVETISGLRQEKLVLEKQFSDLTKLYDQDRSNFEQRAALLSSVKTETEERAKSFDELTCRLDDQERLMNEQIAMIGHLEAELSDRAGQLRERSELEAAWKNEIEEWRSKVAQLQGHLETAQTERDALQTQLYDHEREDAQYALRLTPEERDHAAKSIDALLDQLGAMESRIVSGVETN